MTGPKDKAPDRSLTEVELELMTILWELEGGTVNEVLTRLPPERALAYTSVSTILRILEQKGVVASEKQGRGHRYAPLIAKGAYEVFSLQQVVGKVFGGEPLALVRRLIDGGVLSKQQLSSLKELLAEKEAKAKDLAHKGPRR